MTLTAAAGRFDGRAVDDDRLVAAAISVYALEGNITVTGGAVEWLGRLLGGRRRRGRLPLWPAAVADTGGVYLVPAFAGLGAPHWDERARGLICGLTRGTTAAHVARATIESIAYQVRDVFEAMRAEPQTPIPAAGGWRREPQRCADAVPGGHLGCPGHSQPVGGPLRARRRMAGRAGDRASGLRSTTWRRLPRPIDGSNPDGRARARAATPAGPTPFDARGRPCREERLRWRASTSCG